MKEFSEPIDISVVICTYNRGSMLPGALESVLAQETNGVRYELIVVDNNSTDATSEVVHDYIARGHDNLRYIFEGRQGLSHARNAGIANARAPVIAFTDDDIRAARNWVASIKRAFDEHPEVGYIGGKVLPQWESEPPAWLVNAPQGPLAIRDNGEASFYTNAKNPDCLAGANLAFRREVFDHIGVFAPELQRVKDGIGSMEDHEIQLRIWRDGGQGLYDGRIVVTAEVQAERMKKDYHRRWHTGHGKFSALIRLKEISIEDEQSTEDAEAATLFSIPAYVYRELISEGGHWLTAAARREQKGEAFTRELHVRHLISYIRKRYEQHAKERKNSPLTEIGNFARTLLRKKLYPTPHKAAK